MYLMEGQECCSKISQAWHQISPLWGLSGSIKVAVRHHDYAWPDRVLGAGEGSLVFQQDLQPAIFEHSFWHSKAEVDGLVLPPSVQSLMRQDNSLSHALQHQSIACLY